MNKLNPEQKKAVETIEGPVMVVAGPGTGKTQVLSMRVANILKKTQMRPSNILCLTFSVSGATAMRDRLRLLIGADAYGVRVSTIHAFAQSIIAENPSFFDEWNAKELISDIEKHRSLNKIIDQNLSHLELINPKDPYSRTLDILARISQVKREGKFKKDLEKAATEFDELMAKKSKPGTKANEKNLLSAKKFHDFISLFDAFQTMLEKAGRYDYDDMILHVIRALEEEDWLLASLQERFQYILVDEFQDTNGSQAKLIELLTTYKNAPNEPNIFVVGDDDQAIYRFQGANLQNMLGFYQRFPKAPVIVLTTSYRSTQSILDAAHNLIERNDERLVGTIPGLKKLLVASSAKEGNPLRLLRPPSDIVEPWLIADLAEEQIRAGTAPEEIAILTQTNEELFALYDVLRARGIPVLLKGKDDLLSHSLVLQALTILRAVEHPRNESKLSAALACDCFGVHPADLGRLHSHARDNKIHFFDALLSLENSDAIPFLHREALINARDTVLSFHYKLESRTALETVEHVLRGSGLIPEVENGAESTIDPRDTAAIEAFFAFVRVHCLAKPSCTIEDLISDLDYYDNPDYGQLRLAYDLPHLTSLGVRIMTAHQSKGLEFDVVILSNFRDGHWDKRIRRSGVSIPEDLLFGWDKEQKSTEKHQDERRVAFVASTRARRELIMVCPKELTVGEKTRSVSPSGFFAEMGNLSELDGNISHPESASLLQRPRAKLIDGALRAYLEERLKTFSLSPTALNRFLRDPNDFLLIDLLQQPEHFDEGSVRSLGYGSAVHWALRSWATAHKEGKEFTRDQLLEAFSWYLFERTILTKKQREDLLALGHESLSKYFEQRLTGATPYFHAIEHEYRSHLGDIPLKGKIDRIDRASETSSLATVIDYKAGKAKSENDIRGGLEEGRVSRSEDGSHFRQLTFYALLLEQADPLLKPELFSLEYIGERGENPLTRSFTISEAEKDDLRTLIREVWEKIVKMDFTLL